MLNLKIAVAQIGSIKGNIEKNINTHLVAIEKAASLNVAYLLFPELSLTGYEPEIAKDLAFTIADIRLKPLIDCAMKNNIRIAVGAPLQATGKPKIGLIIISESGIVETYEKMFLHPGEEVYFSHGNRHKMITLGKTKIANAICADTNHASHVQTYYELGTSVYMAGVLISEGGYEADTKLMAGYAKKYNMLVAMANYNQPTGGWSPIGRSTIWSKLGIIASASETQNAIVVAEKIEDGWTGQLYEI